MPRTVLAFGKGGIQLARDALLAACVGLLEADVSLRFVCFHGGECEGEWQSLERLAAAYAAVGDTADAGAAFCPRLAFERRLTGSAPMTGDEDTRLLWRALLGSGGEALVGGGLAGWYLQKGRAQLASLSSAEEPPLVCAAAHEPDGYIPLRLLPNLGCGCGGALLLLPWQEPRDGQPERAQERARETLAGLKPDGPVELLGLPAGEWLSAAAEGFQLVDMLAGASWACLLRGGSGVRCWRLPLEHAGWTDLGGWGKPLSDAWGAAVQEAALLSLELAPQLRERFRARGRGLARGADSAWFPAADRAPAWWQQQAERLDAREACLRACLTAMRQLVWNLPQAMQLLPEAETAMNQAGQAWRKWLEADTLRQTLQAEHDRLEETEGEAVHRTAASISELDRVASDLAKQEKLTETLHEKLTHELEALNSQERIRLLKRMQYGLRRAMTRERQAAAEKRDLVRQAQAYPEEKQNRAGIDRTLAEAARLEAHLDWLRIQADTVQAQLRRAHVRSGAVRQRESRMAETPPENRLFQAKSLEAVCRAVLDDHAGNRRTQRQLANAALLSLPGVMPQRPYPAAQTVMRALTRRGRARHGTADPLSACLTAFAALIREESAE